MYVTVASSDMTTRLGDGWEIRLIVYLDRASGDEPNHR